MIIKIKGLTASITMLKNLKQQVKQEKKELPYKSTLKLKGRIKDRIMQRRGDHTHGGHNTTISLIQFLHGPVKKADGYSVMMLRYPTKAISTGVTYDLPTVVEKGTVPHTIPIIRKDKSGVSRVIGVAHHPGAIAKRYWNNGVMDFVERDFEGVVGASVARIMAKAK